MPRATSLIVAMLLMVVINLSAGTITGTVKAQGAPLEESGGGGSGAYSSRRYKFAEKVDYDRLTDFVVYIDEPLTNVTTAGATSVAITTQRNAIFDPHVLPIAVGTSVKWPNEDEIYHNVFSMSDTKQFDLGLYHQEKVPVLIFDKVGRVDVFCAIHNQMHCIILVVPNPFFTKVDANQKFVIRNVPAGKYKLRAWHERLPSVAREVTVPPDGEVRVDLTLGLSALPKY
jgi:plastocyanin